MVALFSPQKDLSVRIVKSGDGYILQAPGGAQARNQYVRGNKIGFVGSDSMEIPDRITFTVTFDLEVNGDRMTGSLRMEGSDGTSAARSVNCARQ